MPSCMSVTTSLIEFDQALADGASARVTKLDPGGLDMDGTASVGNPAKSFADSLAAELVMAVNENRAPRPAGPLETDETMACLATERPAQAAGAACVGHDARC